MPSRLTQLGWRGEEQARHWLEARGFTFVAAHFRTRYGEIDLIMRQAETTVFVEVKTRRSRKFGLPEEAVSDRKLERLRAAVELYCARHPEVGNVRLDLMLIEPLADQVKIRHISGLD